MSKVVVDLENEVFLNAVDEIPIESKIFTGEQIVYTDALTGQILLNDLKGLLLNVIEGIGLPDKQETAIKRLITNALHETHHEISECLELVKVDNDCSTCVRKVVVMPDTANICAECKILSRGYQKYEYNTGCNHID